MFISFLAVANTTVIIVVMSLCSAVVINYLQTREACLAIVHFRFVLEYSGGWKEQSTVKVNGKTILGGWIESSFKRRVPAPAP